MNTVRKGYIRPVDFKHGRVDMTHGSGGRAMAQLIEELFLAAFDNDWLRAANDNACFAVQGGRMVMATDSHVVSPLFFPGGDIGCLSVHGTVNDVAMSGAKPLYLSASFILEEGFPLADLKRIVDSMAQAAREAGVPIVTGDTKVVEQGKGDGVFITTTGVGVVPEGVNISGDRARPGDAILVSGTLGDHGVAIMSSRESLGFETTIQSDTAALHELVARMVAAVPDIHALRDPTRGGLATTLNEIARQSGVGMLLREEAIPVRQEVEAACEFLGLDPLYVANEGKLVCICAPEHAEELLAVMRAHPLGAEAAIIGSVHADPHHFVQMETGFGGKRIVDWLTGDQLPRNCRYARAHPVPDAQLQQPDAAPIPGVDDARARGGGRVRHLGRGDDRSGRAVPARSGDRTVPEARRSRSRLAPDRLPGRASGHRRRSRTLRARLGDQRRRIRMGRHDPAG
jgi:hydrogenase expression/formation protein HypE